MPWKANGPGCPCCNTCTPTGSHCVTVRGCNSGGVGSGATVALKVGATTIDTCTTDSSSQCCLDIGESRSDYTIAVTPPSGMHFQNYSVGSQSIACGSTTRTVTLTPETGYSCSSPCFLRPIGNSLSVTVTDSVLGSTSTLVYVNATYGNMYELTLTYHGCASPPAPYDSYPYGACGDTGATVKVLYKPVCTGVGTGYLLVAWLGSSAVPFGCPVASGGTYFDFIMTLTAYTEDPFSLTYAVVDPTLWPFWCGGSPTITVTWS